MPAVQPPRFPKLTAPASPAPLDMLKAQAVNEKEVVNALFREPLSALGLAVPELPSLAALGAQMAANLPAPPGLPGAQLQIGAGNETKAPPTPVGPRVIG